MLELRYLEVNVQHCICPMGCCDLVPWAIHWLCDWDKLFPLQQLRVPPRELVVLGTRTAKDRARISQIIGALEHRPQLRFSKDFDLTAAVDEEVYLSNEEMDAEIAQGSVLAAAAGADEVWDQLFL